VLASQASSSRSG